MSILDLNGKVVFKVKLGNEIKKIVIHNDELTFNELCLMMQRIFSEKIGKSDEFTLKYTDEDNDLITVANDNDVLLAIQTNKVLRITIYLKNKNYEQQTGDQKEVTSVEILKELQSIRTSIDKFYENFGHLITNSKSQPTASPPQQQQNETKPSNVIESKMPNLSVSQQMETHKEFDPLANKKGIRSDTPDSVTSMTSSPTTTTTTTGQQHQFYNQTATTFSQQQQYNQSLYQQQYPQQQQQQAQLTEQQQQYLIQQQYYQQQMQQQQQQHHQQQPAANPYSKPLQNAQNRYPTPNFQQQQQPSGFNNK